MCFDLDSRPPIRPIAGGALDAAAVELTADDGTALAAFRARAFSPTGAGIVVLPDVRGLHGYYEELALRFAERGVDAIAIDYFARTAGPAERGPAFEHMPHVEQTTWAGLTSDVRAAAAFLRSPDGGQVRSLFTIGFCFGGRLSLVASTLGLGLAGVVSFYGWPVGPFRAGMPAPAEVAADMEAPVLAIFGGADQGIPADAVSALDRALSSAGVEHTVMTYPNAPHSFFDRKADEFARASAAAWDETIGFIRAHTAAA
jgi:carboxymethylenebutenolidase